MKITSLITSKSNCNTKTATVIFLALCTVKQIKLLKFKYYPSGYFLKHNSYIYEVNEVISKIERDKNPKYEQEGLLIAAEALMVRSD